ncbi:MAG: hypothetical protein WA802_00895 [Terracidiphilus sp.]
MAIKLLHTLVWLFFVACIFAVPVAAGVHRFCLSALFSALVLLECFVLALNQCRCPLSDLAARFTPEAADNSANFDIYLPNWLARHNKTIFGFLFVAGGLFALAQWLLAAR